MSNIELDQLPEKEDTSSKEQIPSNEKNSANVETRASTSVSATNENTIDDSPVKSEEQKINKIEKVVKPCYVSF